MGFAGGGLFGVRRGCQSRTTQEVATPRSADADKSKDESVDDVSTGNDAKVSDKEHAEQKAERGRENPGSPSAICRCDQDRRHVEDVGSATGENWLKCQPNEYR